MAQNDSTSALASQPGVFLPVADAHVVSEGASWSLESVDPSSTPAWTGKPDKEEAAEQTTKESARIAELQERLYAEDKHALLVVLQGMDTSGKDGVIRHVFGGVNPQGCLVTSFKKPTEHEADRDYLWRIHDAVPAKGTIGVFNRAHYEDVLIVRVHSLVPEARWRARYEQINAFERYLTANHVTVLKFMLHISKDEQRERLQARLDDPAKRWKFQAGDLKERARWNDYMAAYQDAVSMCSTSEAPWHVIPADRKWYARWAIARCVRANLEAIDPRPPEVAVDPSIRIV